MNLDLIDKTDTVKNIKQSNLTVYDKAEGGVIFNLNDFKKGKSFLSKPFLAGLCILELSKLVMYLK